MNKIKVISSNNISVAEIAAEYLILKNIKDGIFGVEAAIDKISLNKIQKFHKEENCNVGKIIIFNNEEPKIRSKKIILMGLGASESISYDTIEAAFLNAFSKIAEQQDIHKPISILTVLHGAGHGLEKKEIFIRIVTSLIKVLSRSPWLTIESVIINENGTLGQPQIGKIMKELSILNPELISFSNGDNFLTIIDNYTIKPSEEKNHSFTINLLSMENNNNSKEPWALYSYLIAFIVIIGAFAMVFQVFDIWKCILIVVATIFLILLTGVLQLQNDSKIKEKTFFDIIALILSKTPVLGLFLKSKPKNNLR